MASVIVVNKNSSHEVPLSRTVTVIGRDGGIGLELGDLQVSRRHALLVSAAQGYFVKDLGSRNGVVLNKQRLASRTQANLKNGDVLSLGRTTLIFKDLASGDDVDPTPTPERVQTVQRAQPARPQPISDPPPEEPVVEEEEELERVPEERRTPKGVRRRPASSRHDAIPRAAAPTPVYSGQAEILTLRALVERSERDRVYYRNLTLILFVLLIITLVLVFAWALTQGKDADRGAAAPLPTNAPAPTVAVALDAAAFAATVHPILRERCAACHEHVGRGGDLVLAQGNDAATLEANLASAARFVVPGNPEASSLLLKAVGPEEGGQPHEGGAVLALNSPEWTTLRAWVRGVDLAAPAPTPPSGEPNAPPNAVIDGAELSTVGDDVELSGMGSADPQGDELAFRWTLIESPPGATAVLRDAAARTVRFTPDVPGRYTVALVVRDPLAATGSAEHVLRVEPAPVELGRDGNLSKAWENLLGRSPTANELDGLRALSGSDLRNFFLDRGELYRRWWDAELHHLGLSGRHAPRGEPWDTFPARLQSGKYSVQDAYYALLVGQAWTARHEGRDAYVGAVLEKVLGPERRQDPALREAGNRIYDGHESTLLGKRTKGQVGLVRVTTRHPEALRYLLWRNHREFFGSEPAQDAVDAATARLVETPTDLFAILVDWACQGL